MYILWIITFVLVGHCWVSTLIDRQAFIMRGSLRFLWASPWLLEPSGPSLYKKKELQMLGL